MNVPTPFPPLPLENGDRLTRAEFERRYEAMPEVKKAELIEGVVYMPSPVRQNAHSQPQFLLIGWLSYYQAFTAGVEGGDNGTMRLDLDNEPQPDAFLRILPSHGGSSRTSPDDYVEGPVELVAEIAASSASYDLHAKLNVYRRSGIAEYLVWRVLDREIDWFILRQGQYVRQPPAADGTLASEVFPGLRLEPAALLAGDLARVLQVLQQQLGGPDHAAFIARLQQTATGTPRRQEQ
jgi:Uma2 family endonuclease